MKKAEEKKRFFSSAFFMLPLRLAWRTASASRLGDGAAWQYFFGADAHRSLSVSSLWVYLSDNASASGLWTGGEKTGGMVQRWVTAAVGRIANPSGLVWTDWQSVLRRLLPCITFF